MKHCLSLKSMVIELEKFAPIELAESWDNVGLLIEPSTNRDIAKALLVNDLTEPVLEQAIDSRVELIISFHSPFCNPLTKITLDNWRERVIAKCIQHQIAVYSPHTAWHVSEHGVNDEMCHLLSIGQFSVSVEPIIPHPSNPRKRGSGRIMKFSEALPISHFVEQIQNLFDLKHVQLALGIGQNLYTKIQTVALCAGSRSNILKNVKADLYVTGDMAHPEILDAIHEGTAVIIVNHSNSERVFLRKFAKDFNQKLTSMKCLTRIMLDKENDIEPLLTH